MRQHIDAIFENGVFRPEQPVNIPNGERVNLTVDSKVASADDLSDVLDLLDMEFMETCRKKSGQALPLDAVRETLRSYHGSLAERICEER